MEQGRLQQAINLTEHIMRTYYCQRDIDAVLEQMAPDATWIGPGAREKKYTLGEISTYFEQGKNLVPSCEVSTPDLRVVELGAEYCLVTGSVIVRTTPDSQLLIEVEQRVSFTFRLRDERFEVVHMHLSNPYEEMGEEEFFPHKAGAQSYQYLQQILREKMEVLDMIAANIDGGLKGSNDDDTFSYFYVNEGLPRMLGYTYDEFMEKTGGTAVGAVYPPDCQAAVDECIRCFEKGPVYSTEYRMEKKDGTLMWVMDTGRKVLDSDGITRINSIIMDITPLKQALFELEIERERYRIALQHITGAMCEYDLDEDLFTIYQQSNNKEGKEIKQLEISHFSKKISTGKLLSKEDGEKLRSLCMGEETGVIEFHTQLLHQNEEWCWVQFSCSVLSDHAGIPVRAIGVLKDITKEKQHNIELLKKAQQDGLTGLLNQTTVKERIKEYLRESNRENRDQSTLFMLDLDHFKSINDCNGHMYGDKVLIETACILEQVLGCDSKVGRLGGDEFFALVNNLKAEDVIVLAEELIQKIRGIGNDRGVSISCSIGIVYGFQPEEEYVQLFNRVDQALYQAKNNGRDCFFIST